MHCNFRVKSIAFTSFLLRLLQTLCVNAFIFTFIHYNFCFRSLKKNVKKKVNMRQQLEYFGLKTAMSNGYHVSLFILVYFKISFITVISKREGTKTLLI